MEAIDWDWDNHDDHGHFGIARVSPHVVATVRRDEFGWPSPLVDSDCYPPCHISIDYGRNKGTVEGSSEPETPTLTREQIRENAGVLCDVFNVRSLLELAQTASYYYHSQTTAEDAINDAIVDRLAALSNENVGDYHAALEDVYRIAGIDFLSTSSVGYSQGDHACLFIWVPLEKRVDFANIEGDTKPALEDTEKTVSAWLWGDVYGYTLFEVHPSLKTEEFDAADHEPVDSCCGFYGQDHEENGLNWYVREMAAHIEREKDKARATIEARVASVASVWRNAAVA